MSSVPALLGYHHLGLTVSDVEASERWYAETLGLVRAFTEKHDNETGYAVVLMRPGTSFFIGLDHHAEADKLPFDARRTGLDHFSLAVSSREEIDTWAAHFDALGVDHDPIKESSEPLPHAMVGARDPDGISFEIFWIGA